MNYPNESKYKDFKKRPRWKEYIAFSHHPLGLWCHNHKYFAYIDTEKKEWDFTKEVDLVYRQIENEDERKSGMEKRELVEDMWEFFPRTNQGYFNIDCFVKYADIATVDDKGDVLYKFPHLYVDFVGDKGPFVGFRGVLEIGNRKIDLTDEYKQIKVFPNKFQRRRFGNIYKDKMITFDPVSLEQFKKYERVNALYDSDEKYGFLNSEDVILVADTDAGADKAFIQITHRFKAKIKDYLEHVQETFGTRSSISQQLGRELDENEEINIYEFRRIYRWKLEKGT